MADLEGYRFRGMQAEGSGSTLSGAIEDLGDFWASRPSLVSHAWGVLTLQITIGATQVTIELTDPQLLDDLEGGDINSLIDKLAEYMQMDRSDAKALLSETTDVVASVDRIRPPVRPGAPAQWTVDPAMDPQAVLPDASISWARDLAKEVDREARRDKGRVRTRRGRALLRMVVQSGAQQGLTDAQIARRTGVPRSTVRDARQRLDRDRRVAGEFRTRRPGQRYTPEQRGMVLQRLAEEKGNAAEVARQLGIAPRTVRDIRSRAARPARRPGAARKTYAPSDRQQLIDLVRGGLSATEAGRQLGVPGRTARGWVRRERLERED